MKNKPTRIIFSLILLIYGLFAIISALRELRLFFVWLESECTLLSILSAVCITLPTLLIGIICVILPVYKLPDGFLQRTCRIAIGMLAAGALVTAADLLFRGTHHHASVTKSAGTLLKMLPCVLVSHIGTCLHAEGAAAWMPILRCGSSSETASLRTLFFRLGRMLLLAASVCLLLNCAALITFYPSLYIRGGMEMVETFISNYMFDYSSIPFIIFAIPAGILALIAFFKENHRLILLILAACLAFLAVISACITIILQFGWQQSWMFTNLPGWTPIAILACIFSCARKKAA